MTEHSPQHTPHSRHRAELRERAFELHCQLQSNRAIAVALGVPERTVRAWIKDILDETTRGLKQRRVEFLREAICGQRAIAAAAWSAFNLTMDHERARLSASPLLARRGAGGEDIPSPGDEDTSAAAADTLPLDERARLSASPLLARRGVGGEDTPSPGDKNLLSSADAPTTIYRSARLLHVAFAAQREIAHLLRLYDDDVVPHQPVEILITRRPPWPEPDPSDYIPGTPDDPNYQPDDEANDDDDNGLPADLKPTGNDPWRERHGYPPKSVLDSSPASENQQPHSTSSVGEGASGLKSRTTKIENTATPATAISSASPLTPPSPESQVDGAATLAPASLTGGPEVAPPERPGYPVAWLFPPGAPIPRPYRNAPLRPHHAFWNNPLRW